MSESTTKQARLGNDRAFGFENAEVISRGQVTIPENHREVFDLEEGDYVNAEFYYEGNTISASDRVIGNSGRITIPASSRKRYGIEKGDRVDVTVYLD